MVAALALILDAALAFAIWASAPGTGRLRRRPPIGSNVTDHASKSPGRSPNVDP
jgi:osmoprotectant transport system permease protein